MTHGFNLGWYALEVPDSKTEYKWKPVLQLIGYDASFELYFETEEECLLWISENVLDSRIRPT